MILKNKLTKETLDIPYSEFRKKFAKEIQDAFESYRKTQLNKYSWNFKDDNSLEFNFYFELHWNFIILKPLIGILKISNILDNYYSNSIKFGFIQNSLIYFEHLGLG